MKPIQFLFAFLVVSGMLGACSRDDGWIPIPEPEPKPRICQPMETLLPDEDPAETHADPHGSEVSPPIGAETEAGSAPPDAPAATAATQAPPAATVPAEGVASAGSAKVQEPPPRPDSVEPTEPKRRPAAKPSASLKARAAVQPAAHPSAAPGECIDIRTAGPTELERLPRVGPARALKIVATRERRPFTQKRHIKRVKGIGPATYRKMEALICPM